MCVACLCCIVAEQPGAYEQKPRIPRLSRSQIRSFQPSILSCPSTSVNIHRSAQRYVECFDMVKRQKDNHARRETQERASRWRHVPSTNDSLENNIHSHDRESRSVVFVLTGDLFWIALCNILAVCTNISAWSPLQGAAAAAHQWASYPYQSCLKHDGPQEATEICSHLIRKPQQLDRSMASSARRPQ